LDADLQDPPELIEVFLQHWQEGFKVVSGVRVERSESKWISWIRRFGYWFIDLASEYPIKRNTGDFRLLDRQVVEALTKIKSPKPYLRGTISRMGVREKDVLYSRSARKFGQSKFGLWALIKLGLTALANHSNISIKLGNIVGFLALMLSIAGSLYVMYLRVFQPELPRGFASIYIMILFGIGVNAILLSILGSFVKKIYEILSEEDLTIVVDKIQ
jgi:dolichol-phosphate mannosyltransferase